MKPCFFNKNGDECSVCTINSTCIAKKPRCFGRLFSPIAKECSLCKHSVSCSKNSVYVKRRRGSIRDALCMAMKECPKTISELRQLIGYNRGTSVYYHLAKLKAEGILIVTTGEGKRRYSLFEKKVV